MNGNTLVNIVTAILGVAAITAFVASPNTAAVITAAGNALATSTRAALGH